MSAGLKCSNEIFWGTNGLVGACLDAFEKIADRDYGADDPIAKWCQEEKKKFFPGAVVVLDPLLESEGVRKHLVSVVVKSEELLMREYELTDLGRTWVSREIPRLAATLEKRNKA